MNPILRNIIAVVLGWFIGSVVNMSLITAGHSTFPIPGLDPNDMEALAAIMPTLGAKYYLFPFLAHALGTLTGAIIAGLIATNHKMKFSLAIGGLFLIGGVLVNFMIRGPLWFIALDIIVAYIPMALIGGKIALKLSKNSTRSEGAI